MFLWNINPSAIDVAIPKFEDGHNVRLHNFIVRFWGWDSPACSPHALCRSPITPPPTAFPKTPRRGPRPTATSGLVTHHLTSCEPRLPGVAPIHPQTCCRHLDFLHRMSCAEISTDPVVVACFEWRLAEDSSTSPTPKIMCRGLATALSQIIRIDGKY